MLRRSLLKGALALPAAARAAEPRLPAESGPAVDAVAALISQQTDAQVLLGAVACVTDRYGQRTATAGQSGAGRPLDADSVFEIGSITKVFTALLLAEMAGRGEVSVNDAIAAYLPPEVRPQTYDGKPVTLLDLATHTSGLPPLPANFRPKDLANPYADYTVAQAYEALETVVPDRYPGSHFAYSNLGFGLLGHVLALRAGRPYEDLLVSRICAPLGLDSTRITLSSDQQSRLAPGHDATLAPVANWDLPTLAGAGALRSTARDMLRLLECCLGRVASPIAPWLATTLDIRRQADGPGEAAAAGWFVQTAHYDELVWKDGDTGGYSSFIGYSTRTGIGSVVLSNTLDGIIVPQLGRFMVNASFPNPAPRKRLAVTPPQLAALKGLYALTPGFVLTVTPGEGKLLVRATGQAEYPVFAETSTSFYYTAIEAQLRFEVGPDGQAVAVTLHQNGRDMRGLRRPLPP